MNTESTTFFRSWMLLLIMPLIGFIGMIAILLGNNENAEPTNTSASNIQLLDESTPLPQTIPPRTLPPTPTSIFNQPVPTVTLTNLTGETFTLDDYRGKIIVLNFWATWCTPCIEEMPTLQAFYDNHTDEDFTILLVTDPEDGQDRETIEQFLKDLDITLPVAFSEYGQLHNLFGVQMIPSTYFIDVNGIVRNRWIGPIDTESLAKEIELVRTDAS
ncbi:MAG: hypothetical protein CUN55_07465 [Phototrophicales bacterium]|nr:MAG: hypothetical protein CUN55_07465 [Phototrophicales bacterium]